MARPTNPDTDPSKWKPGGGGRQRSRELAEQNAPKNPNLSIPRKSLTEQRKSRFLEALAEFGSVTKAAQITDANPHTRRAYLVLASKEPAFQRAMDDAMEQYRERVAAVVREELFEGVLTPIVNGKGIVKDKNGNEVWVRKRDARVVLAVAKAFDWTLREVKTVVNIDGTPQANPNDPQIILKSSDLWRLDAADAATLTRILGIIHKNRSEDMADFTPRPEYLEDHTIEDAEFTDVPPEQDEDPSDEQEE